MQRGGGRGGRRCGCAPGRGIAAPVSQPGPASVVLGQLLPCGPGVEASCPTGPASPPRAEEGGVSRQGLSVDGGLESRGGVGGCSREHGVGRLDLGEWEGRRGTGGGVSQGSGGWASGCRGRRRRALGPSPREPLKTGRRGAGRNREKVQRPAGSLRPHDVPLPQGHLPCFPVTSQHPELSLVQSRSSVAENWGRGSPGAPVSKPTRFSWELGELPGSWLAQRGRCCPLGAHGQEEPLPPAALCPLGRDLPRSCHLSPRYDTPPPPEENGSGRGIPWGRGLWGARGPSTGGPSLLSSLGWEGQLRAPSSKPREGLAHHSCLCHTESPAGRPEEQAGTCGAGGEKEGVGYQGPWEQDPVNGDREPLLRV